MWASFSGLLILRGVAGCAPICYSPILRHRRRIGITDWLSLITLVVIAHCEPQALINHLPCSITRWQRRGFSGFPMMFHSIHSVMPDDWTNLEPINRVGTSPHCGAILFKKSIETHDSIYMAAALCGCGFVQFLHPSDLWDSGVQMFQTYFLMRGFNMFQAHVSIFQHKLQPKLESIVQPVYIYFWCSNVTHGFNSSIKSIVQRNLM